MPILGIYRLHWAGRGQPPPPSGTGSFPRDKKHSPMGSDGRRHLQVDTPDPFGFPRFWGSCWKWHRCLSRTVPVSRTADAGGDSTSLASDSLRRRVCLSAFLLYKLLHNVLAFLQV